MLPRRSGYVLAVLCVAVGAQQSACSLQDFDALDAGLVSGPGGSGGETGGTGGDAGSSTGGTGGTGGGAPEPTNLIPDPSFEDGHDGWFGFGGAALLDSTEGPRTGERCLAATNRFEGWHGPAYDALPLVSEGGAYRLTAWMRIDSGSAAATLSLKTTCAVEGDTYTALGTVQVSQEWSSISGLIRVPECTLTVLQPYFEASTVEATIYLDDVSLVREEP